MQEDYQLFTTTRYDPTLTRLRWNDDLDGPSPFFLLPYHYERLRDAVKAHSWDIWNPYTYQQFKSVIADTVTKQLSGTPNTAPALRIRILLNKNGDIQVSAIPLEAAFSGDPFQDSATSEVEASSPTLIRISIDRESTTPSLFTKTKTTARRVYEEARSRNSLEPFTTPKGRSQEVLLHNREGVVMETSIYNIAFKRGEHWVTPSVSSGCLPGVARRWLLENNRIVEDTLTVADIKEGEVVLLFNGLQGCRFGIIRDDA